mmetsp:Transcript_37257/g.119750  ORF Transcript_37257/g.119750 Transcript_37257/m.119750 type:complete len:153 (+) Transcript_37257:1095-1553(+)
MRAATRLKSPRSSGAPPRCRAPPPPQGRRRSQNHCKGMRWFAVPLQQHGRASGPSDSPSSCIRRSKDSERPRARRRWPCVRRQLGFPDDMLTEPFLQIDKDSQKEDSQKEDLPEDRFEQLEKWMEPVVHEATPNEDAWSATLKVPVILIHRM